MASGTPMININLNTPTTPDEIKFAKIPGIYNSNGSQRPRQDETDDCNAVHQEQRRAWSTSLPDNDKPFIRFYAVGPSTYQISCPLCHKRADTETVKMSGALGQLSCLLSTFSCCFPIFSLSFIYLCLQSRLKSKRLFCNQCGGHLGFYWRPT